VSISDVTEIQRHIAEHIQLTGKAAANADYNQDGVINIDDATAIQRFLAEFAPVSVN
ncbi:MAG: dockerin type I repeat-containing protein, partial [Ruminococcus sp.]|nr:dockerin type I repeat-containing protein [Ruminococcus sp.]